MTAGSIRPREQTDHTRMTMNESRDTPGSAESLSLRNRGRRGLPLDGVLVIDNHCHMRPMAEACQPDDGADGLIRTMDRIGIDQACVFSAIGINLDMRAGNELNLAAARAYPDRLLPYAAVDPHHAELVADELQRCFDGGMRGIKLHVQIADYPFDGPGYQPAFAFADDHRLPLISHGVGTAETLRRVARAHPNAHFIVAHVGGASPQRNASTAALVQVTQEEPNVYLDLASSVGQFGAFEAMVAAVGAGKLLYGSDMPFMCDTHQIGRVLMASISDEDKRRILGTNMAALLATRR